MLRLANLCQHTSGSGSSSGSGPGSGSGSGSGSESDSDSNSASGFGVGNDSDLTGSCVVDERFSTLFCRLMKTVSNCLVRDSYTMTKIRTTTNVRALLYRILCQESVLHTVIDLAAH